MAAARDGFAEMTLHQTSSSVRNVDVPMRRQINGPSRVDRLSKHFIDHPPTPSRVTINGNSNCRRKFPIFPKSVRGSAATDIAKLEACRCGARATRDD